MLSQVLAPLAIGMLLIGACRASAAQPELWFAPPDDIMQPGHGDYQGLFTQPESWTVIANKVQVFSTTGNYLVRSSPDLVKRLLGILRDRGIRLNVSIPALPVDKHVCGAEVEGMIWPGEALLYARRLKSLGAQVDSFTFDEPLSYGHLYRGKNACRLSIESTAQQLALSVHQLREVYPRARLIDAEVPTGRPVADWQRILREWLAAYREKTGEELSGFSMDLYWHFDWLSAATVTIHELHERGIRAGYFLDSDGRPGTTVAQWIGEAKMNACHMRATGLPVDYVVVANWTLPAVRNLPETDPLTLAGLVNWYDGSFDCRP